MHWKREKSFAQAAKFYALRCAHFCRIAKMVNDLFLLSATKSKFVQVPEQQSVVRQSSQQHVLVNVPKN